MYNTWNCVHFPQIILFYYKKKHNNIMIKCCIFVQIQMSSFIITIKIMWLYISMSFSKNKNHLNLSTLQVHIQFFKNYYLNIFSNNIIYVFSSFHHITRGLFVFVKVGFQSKVFAAASTLKGFRIRVGLSMGSEIRFVGKSFRTKATSVWSFA